MQLSLWLYLLKTQRDDTKKNNSFDDNKQDRQDTYNVTLRRVRATTIAVENQQVLHTLNVCL